MLAVVQNGTISSFSLCADHFRSSPISRPFQGPSACLNCAEADINYRDCDVRSLAGPEPDQIGRPSARLKDLLRKPAARSAETICVTSGEILRAFTPTECANYFRNSGYAQS
jgi:hypothetical protein